MADTGNDRIAQFAADGTFVRTVGGSGGGDGGLDYPRGVAVSPSGDLYVVDTVNQSVQQFAADGSFVRAFGGSGIGFGQFQSPRGVAIAADGDVLVADAINDRIQRFGPDGEFRAAWGPGRAPGTFRGPLGVASGSGGGIYVADTLNNRVERLAADGSFVNAWGVTGGAAGQFNLPQGVAVAPSGDVYVVDRATVQRFPADGGHVLRRWGGYGAGPSEFQSPRGIAVAPGGDVYVADTNNYRVQRFTANGELVDSFPVISPVDVAIGPTGDVYVLDSLESLVQLFRADGTFVRSWGSRGEGDGQFLNPSGLSVAANGDVYVADPGADSVQQFTATGDHVATARSSLLDGVNSVAATGTAGRVVATSPAGLLAVYTQPTRPPAPTLTATDPPSPSPSATPSVEGTAQAGTEVRLFLTSGCSGDPAAVGDAEALADPGIQIAVPPDGESQIRAVAVDDAGRESLCSRPLAYVADAAGPTTTIDSGPAEGATVSSATVDFGFSSPDTDLRTFRCRLDSGAFSSCTPPKQYTGLADGKHTFTVGAVDRAGNVEAAPPTRTFYVYTGPPDSTAPTTSIDSGPAAGATIKSSTTFRFSSPDSDLRGFECRLDGAAFGPCTSPKPLSGLADGAHTFSVRAVDRAGNVEAAPPSRSFYVYTGPPDSTRPTATIDSGPSGNVPHELGGLHLLLDGERPARAPMQARRRALRRPASRPSTTRASPTASHSFAVRAVDLAGNIQTPASSRAFTVDTRSPTTRSTPARPRARP